MRTRLGALALATGVAAALLPTGPAAAIPTPVPTRKATIAVDGGGRCWTGSAEGRLTWTPGAPVRSVRVTATVRNAMADGRARHDCFLVPGTRAVYTAYANGTATDSREIGAYEGIVAISFDLTAGVALTGIDRVEVTMCWWPDVVAEGFEAVETCDEDGTPVG
jgi:hypothetical protein